MSPTRDSTLAGLQQKIDDLQRQLAERTAEREEALGDGSLRLITPLFAVVIPLIEIEHVKEVADCWRIGRRIGIVFVRARVRQIIAAADGERVEVPVALDEFEDRDMVVIAMHHMPTSRIG